MDQAKRHLARARRSVVAESKIRLEDLQEAARQELRQEYFKMRDAKVQLWLSGRSKDSEPFRSQTKTHAKTPK